MHITNINLQQRQNVNYRNPLSWSTEIYKEYHLYFFPSIRKALAILSAHIKTVLLNKMKNLRDYKRYLILMIHRAFTKSRVPSSDNLS